MKKILFRGVPLLIAVFTAAAFLASCDAYLNERQKGAIKAFDDILAVLPAEEKDGWFQLIAPDRGATFAFRNDNASLCVDATPFIAAGLDVGKLENVCESIFYKTDYLFSLPGWNMLDPQNKDTASAQFKANIQYYKVVEGDETFKINFADNYNTLSNAAVFEWAKEAGVSGRYIIFKLAAGPLSSAGVDPQKVEGWEYVNITTGVNGKTEWVFQKVFALTSSNS